MVSKPKKSAKVSIYLGGKKSIKFEMYKDDSNLVTYPKEMSSVEMVQQLRNLGYMLTRIVTEEAFEFLENKLESDTITKEDGDE